MCVLFQYAYAYAYGWMDGWTYVRTYACMHVCISRMDGRIRMFLRHVPRHPCLRGMGDGYAPPWEPSAQRAGTNIP